MDRKKITEYIVTKGKTLGFQDVGISGIDLGETTNALTQWLAQGYAGEMHFLAKHGSKRTHPEELVPNTMSIISARLHYADFDLAASCLSQPEKAYIARYALGRDYHKTFKQKLKQLVHEIQKICPTANCRIFVDSAPVMEVQIATQAGIGWRGKNTLLLTRKNGSNYFLGEIYTDLALEPNQILEKNHCGRCQRCLDVCPTQAFVKPYVLNASRCISYLTIEYDGLIPSEFRPLMGNRVYGCDDCQLVCPWNRFAQATTEIDFAVRHGLDQADLLTLFQWNEATFLEKMAGSPIYRIGYTRWQRNLSIGLGNAPANATILTALRHALQHTSSILLQEHFIWAIQEQEKKLALVGKSEYNSNSVI